MRVKVLFSRAARWAKQGGLVFCLTTATWAQPVGTDTAVRAAQTFIRWEQARWERQPELRPAPVGRVSRAGVAGWQVAGVTPITNPQNQVLAYVVPLQPEGFVLISGRLEVQPILGFSLAGAFPGPEATGHPLRDLVIWDMEAQAAVLAGATGAALAAAGIDAGAEANRALWLSYTADTALAAVDSKKLSQWPTNANGWLTASTWHQSAPYNQSCPLDLNAAGQPRCVVGCMATAMAQLLNYWQYPASVRFDFRNRYTSIGGAGRIRVDNNAATNDFPNFTQLNSRLSQIKYDGSDACNADLSFAAGVKLHMDYGSGSVGSGSYNSQLVEAYVTGFSYYSAVLVEDYSVAPAVWAQNKSRVIGNLTNGYPVQISMTRTNNEGGHSVLLEGYRSDDAFLMNLGWGGNDVWYYPATLPAGFSMVTSVLLNILPYAPPRITTQPVGRTLASGQSALFQVRATSSVPPQYQWRHNGTNLVDNDRIIGAGSSNLTFKSVGAAEAGSYQVSVKNRVGAVTSLGVTLTVLIPVAPTITLLSRPSDPAFEFVLTGEANSPYVISVSSDLVRWTVLATNRTGTNGVFRWVDPDAAGWPQRFYRAAVP